MVSEEEVMAHKDGSIYWIIFNRPSKKNATTLRMYRSLTEHLHRADRDADVLFTVFTGNGDFYSSGNDFEIRQLEMEGTSTLDEIMLLVKGFVDALIVHSKVLVALVNGPAIGIACTTLALFDSVLASSRAYFWCPFTQLGLLPEGASTHSFIKCMGHTQAARLLLFSEKVGAHEAKAAGLVSKVFDDAEFKQRAEEHLQRYAKLSSDSLLVAKRLLREREVPKLLQANAHEIHNIQGHWRSPAVGATVMGRFKSKI